MSEHQDRERVRVVRPSTSMPASGHPTGPRAALCVALALRCAQRGSWTTSATCSRAARKWRCSSPSSPSATSGAASSSPATWSAMFSKTGQTCASTTDAHRTRGGGRPQHGNGSESWPLGALGLLGGPRAESPARASPSAIVSERHRPQRILPEHSGQTVTSIANTFRKSHAHGFLLISPASKPDCVSICPNSDSCSMPGGLALCHRPDRSGQDASAAASLGMSGIPAPLFRWTRSHRSMW